MKKTIHSNVGQSHGKAFSKWLVVTLGFLVIVLLLLSAYLWREKDLAERSANTSNQELVHLKEQEATATNHEDGTIMNRYEVSELGVSLELPTKLSNVTYKLVNQDDFTGEDAMVGFSTDEITSTYPMCAAGSGTSPLGYLIRKKGQADTNDMPSQYLVKQFDDFYIAYSGPSSPCHTEQQEPFTEQAIFEYFLYTVRESS